MQVDAVHVNVNQERQVDGSGSRSGKGKSGKGSKGKSKKGGKGKERGEKAASKFEGECRYCQDVFERTSQLAQIQRRRQRTSSRTRVSATGAATACEP